jgi:hypothetical protein
VKVHPLPLFAVNFAFGKDSPETSAGQRSRVKKAFRLGASGVSECPSDSAKAYPSPVEPVWRYAWPPVVSTTLSAVSGSGSSFI